MRAVMLADEEDFDGWRDASRGLVQAGVPPEEIVWQVGETPTDLFGDEAPPEGSGPFSVPRAFVALAKEVVSHSDPARFALLYTYLTRLRREPGLIADAADPLRRRLEDMAKAVRRDIHKMRAFVRFREIAEEDGSSRFVAWFEPEHHIVRANAAFFVRRFANMRWSILTPELSIHWDGETLCESVGAVRGDAPEGDPIEAMWGTYYASIFNPARVKIGAMLKEMPKKYWKNMPETALVPSLIAGAQARTARMIETDMARRPTAPPPDEADYDSLAQASGAAEACTRCPLYKDATQVVFGEGPAHAPLMFVGEQPGDQEDLAGHPFIGPAGQKFDSALALAGIDRGDAYVTNAVKHFKFERRGKRRIHQTPQAPEIAACNHWLRAERKLVRPKLTVALGATAARAVLGKTVTIGKMRGSPISLDDGSEGWVTVHPSYLLRVDPSDADAEFEKFVGDLIAVRDRLAVLST